MNPEKHNGVAQYILAGIVVVGFFAVLVLMIQQGVRDAVMLMIGTLAAAFGGVIGYYYGSSAGSARKDLLLAQSAPVNPVTPTLK